MFLTRLFIVSLCSLPLAPALAHEFWIAPERFQVNPGETLEAHFINGQEFRGNRLSFFDRSSARFEQIVGEQRSEITPRAGDSPALNIPAPDQDALVVVVHETTPSSVTYTEWAKFLKFVAHKDFATAAADHIAAGWSQEKFKESYTRHAKALFAVGDGSGADAETGMKTEFVAITNPYDAIFNNQMKVFVLFEGRPRPDAQVEVFDRAPDDSVTVTLHRTDAEGMATIAVTPKHEYLFDAVTLRASPNAGETPETPVWQTFWAALTFKVPG